MRVRVMRRTASTRMGRGVVDPEERRAVGGSDEEAICRTIGFVFASGVSWPAALTSFFNSHCDA